MPRKSIILPPTWAAWVLFERFRVECLRSILINTHLIEAAYRAGVERYFFSSSSACAYSTLLQQDSNVRALKESDAYPAMAERGYGWEKLISDTMFCQEYWAERDLKTFIARFHNVYGPHGYLGMAAARKLPQPFAGRLSRRWTKGTIVFPSGAMATRRAVSCISMIVCEELI